MRATKEMIKREIDAKCNELKIDYMDVMGMFVNGFDKERENWVAKKAKEITDYLAKVGQLEELFYEYERLRSDDKMECEEE